MDAQPHVDFPEGEPDSRNAADSERDALPAVSALTGAGAGAAGLGTAAATGAIAGLPGGPAGAIVGAAVGLIAGASVGGAVRAVSASRGVDTDGNIAAVSENEEAAAVIRSDSDDIGVSTS